MAQYLTEEERFRRLLQPDNADSGESPLEAIDFAKILYILRKNWYWLIIFPFLSVSVAYLYLRYTKPIFQSTANLKMEFKDESAGLDLRIGLNQENPIDNIAGELEVIRSPLIYEEVLNNINLSVEYYAEGRILDNEMHGFSPIEVQALVLNENLYNQKFYIESKNAQTYKIEVKNNKNTIAEYQGRFGEWLKNKDIELLISLKQNLANYNESIYFVLNSKGKSMNYLANNLEAFILNPQAKIISITFKDYNANKARDVLRTISEVYRVKSVEIKNRANRQKKEYLDAQIEKTEKELNAYEAEMERFIIQNKTNNIEGKISELVNKIQQLTEERYKINAKLQTIIELEIFVNQRFVDSKNIPLMPDVDGAILQQISELNRLRQIRQQQELSETSASYSYQTLDIKINNLQKNISESIDRYKKKILKELAEITQKLAEIEANFLGLPSKITEFNKLKKKYETVQSYYNNLIQQKIQIGLAEAGTVPNFEIISPASMPSIPISPKKTLIYGVAGGIGVLLSLLLIVGKYLLKDTIGSQQELEKLVSMPVVGAIPKYRRFKMEHSKLIVHQNPKSVISESFRNIRTNLDFMFPRSEKEAGQKVVSVTSTISGEGKTFVTINLGGIIAMSGLRVVIIDLDMRKPKVHLGLNGSNEKGISTILIGRHSLEECLRTTEIENLSYISAGPVPPNPSELILRNEFKELIKTLKELYDVVLIDTPPVGLVTDAMLIMSQVDVRFFVLRANYSRRGFAKNIQKITSLQQIRSVGLILNAVEEQGKYGYGYGYGYGYYEEKNAPKSTGWLAKFKTKLLFWKK